MWPQTIRKSDLRIDFYRASGPGGQHKNKTASACRLTHLPTGVVANCAEGRHQMDNRTRAFRKLAAKLVPIMKLAARTGPERTRTEERIRTYHFPRSTVTDHRSGRSYPLQRVLDGDLEEVIRDVAAARQHR